MLNFISLPTGAEPATTGAVARGDKTLAMMNANVKAVRSRSLMIPSPSLVGGEPAASFPLS